MNLQNINQLMIVCSNLPESDNSIWQKLTENLITGFFTVIGIAFAALLAYLYAIRQKKKGDIYWP